MELKQAKEENEDLRSKLGPQASGVLEDTALTKLRFDKQALENKLRKYIAYCQNLEDKRVGILQVLRSTTLEDVDDNDIEKAVVVLCDKLASLEEECDALAKSENRASSDLVELDKLQIQNSSLTCQVSEHQNKIDKLVKLELEQKDLVASLKSEIADDRSFLTP